MRQMRRALMSLAIAGALAVSVVALAKTNLAALFALTPGEMKFVPEPARPGLASSVLVGDPSKAGIYAVHTKLPANFRIEPHSHSERWRIATVLSGVLYYGYSTYLNIQFPALSLVDVPLLVDACTDRWYNQTLCKVNDSVVRLGVLQGEYHWHKHDMSKRRPSSRPEMPDLASTTCYTEWLRFRIPL